MVSFLIICSRLYLLNDTFVKGASRVTREDLLSYTVSDLKRLARERGVNLDGVLEKRELVERIVQHVS